MAVMLLLRSQASIDPHHGRRPAQPLRRVRNPCAVLLGHPAGRRGLPERLLQQHVRPHPCARRRPAALPRTPCTHRDWADARPPPFPSPDPAALRSWRTICPACQASRHRMLPTFSRWAAAIADTCLQSGPLPAMPAPCLPVGQGRQGSPGPGTAGQPLLRTERTQRVAQQPGPQAGHAWRGRCLPPWPAQPLLRCPTNPPHHAPPCPGPAGGRLLLQCEQWGPDPSVLPNVQLPVVSRGVPNRSVSVTMSPRSLGVGRGGQAGAPATRVARGGGLLTCLAAGAAGRVACQHCRRPRGHAPTDGGGGVIVPPCQCYPCPARLPSHSLNPLANPFVLCCAARRWIIVAQFLVILFTLAMCTLSHDTLYDTHNAWCESLGGPVCV